MSQDDSDMTQRRLESQSATTLNDAHCCADREEESVRGTPRLRDRARWKTACPLLSADDSASITDLAKLHTFPARVFTSSHGPQFSRNHSAHGAVYTPCGFGLNGTASGLKCAGKTVSVDTGGEQIPAASHSPLAVGAPINSLESLLGGLQSPEIAETPPGAGMWTESLGTTSSGLRCQAHSLTSGPC